MKKLLPAFLSIAIFWAGAAHAAHAKLTKSTPEDGSVSDTPPAAFVLEFTEPVTLHEVYIKADGKETPIRNLQHNDAKTITIPAPSLKAGQYVLEWSVFTHDSIVLSGRLRFTVSAGAVAAPPSAQ